MAETICYVICQTSKCCFFRFKEYGCLFEIILQLLYGTCMPAEEHHNNRQTYTKLQVEPHMRLANFYCLRILTFRITKM